MPREVKMPPFILARDNFDFFFDFQNFTSGNDGVSSLIGTGASAAVADGAAGVLTLATGATINTEVAARTTQGLYTPANNRPVFAECRVQYAEAATNMANVCFGLADAATGAGLMQAANAGPRTTGTQALIYKAGGSNVWRAQARNGTQVTDSGSLTPAGGAAYTTLRVEIHDMSTSQGTVYYTVDGVPLRDAVTGLAINHQLNYAAAGICKVIFYMQCGSAVSEGAALDYLGGSQVRF